MKRHFWKNTFAIDYRSVVLFRMGLGLCLLWDCLERLRDAKYFLSDFGVLPLRLYTLQREIVPGFSSYSWSGGELWVTSLLLFTIFLAGALFWNFYPRCAAAAAWLMTVSVQHRNPYDVYGGDALLATALLWALFLPLSGPEQKDRKSFSNGVSLAVFVQIAIIYAFAGWKKSGTEWMDGSAVFYALSIGMYGRPIGEWLLQFPTLLKLATFLVLYLERLGWLSFFIPSPKNWIRTVGFLLFAIMHLAFIFCLRLHFFPWLDIAFLTLLIPTEAWDWVQARSWPTPPVRMPAMTASGRHWGTARSVGALILVLWLALINFQGIGKVQLPQRSWELSSAFRLYQEWGFFAPNPFSFSHWFVWEVTYPDKKKEIVALNGFGAKSFERPASVSETYPTLDWLRFSPVLMQGDRLQKINLAVGRFACRVWNKEESQRVVAFSLYIVRDFTKADFKAGSDMRINKIMTGDCRHRRFNLFPLAVQRETEPGHNPAPSRNER